MSYVTIAVNDSEVKAQILVGGDLVYDGSAIVSINSIADIIRALGHSVDLVRESTATVKIAVTGEAEFLVPEKTNEELLEIARDTRRQFEPDTELPLIAPNPELTELDDDFKH